VQSVCSFQSLDAALLRPLLQALWGLGYLLDIITSGFACREGFAKLFQLSKWGVRMRIILFVLLTFGAVASNAAPLTWTIENAVLTSQFGATGTMSGSFGYDSGTNTYSDVAISVSGFYDLGVPEDIYVWNGTYSDISLGTALQLNSQKPSPNPEQPVYLTLDFSSVLTGTGGTVAINSGVVLTNALYISDPPYAVVLGDGATVSAVPVPAAVWLFGSALLSIGWRRRGSAP
jgi:hypothetical protein